MFLRFIFKKSTKNFFSGLSGLARNLHQLEWEIKKKKNKNRRRTITAVLRHNNNTTNL